MAADLSGADLRLADLVGADLRDANLAGADLTEVLFLTQAQLNAARGDASTRLPAALKRPAHWPETAETPAPAGRAPRKPQGGSGSGTRSGSGAGGRSGGRPQGGGGRQGRPRRG